MRNISRGVQLLYERVILRGRGLDLVAVNGAIVRRADEFVPVAARSAAVLGVRSDVFQIFAAVAVAQECSQFGVGKERDILGTFYGVEVGNERNGDPVIAVDAVVAAEDNAGFSGGAAPQNDRRLSAHVGEVDGGVAGRGKESQLSVRLFQEQGGGSVGKNRAGQGKQDCPAEYSPH